MLLIFDRLLPLGLIFSLHRLQGDRIDLIGQLGDVAPLPVGQAERLFRRIPDVQSLLRLGGGRLRIDAGGGVVVGGGGVVKSARGLRI